MKKLVAYTSEYNKAFCKPTGLYAHVLSYQDDLPEEYGGVVMVEISG